MDSNRNRISIEALCNLDRYAAMSCTDKCRVLAYAPVGLALLAVRVCAVVAFAVFAKVVAAAAPGAAKGRWLKALLLVLGQRVRCVGVEHLQDAAGPQVVVSNHVALTDLWALAQLGGSVVCAGRASPLESMMANLGDVIFIDDLRTLRRQVQSRFDATGPRRIFVTPEGTINNGAGLYAYQKFAFSLGVPVCPAAVEVRSPFNLKLTTVGPNRTLSQLADYAWLLFLPRVSFNVSFMAPESRQDGETSAAFATRVQRLVAERLSVVPTDYTPADKRAFRQQRFQQGASHVLDQSQPA